MKVYSLLNEQEEFDIEKFLLDCEEYLKIAASAKHEMYRGMELPGGDWMIAKSLKNRKPLMSSPELHHAVDALMKSIVGWNTRSEGVFVTASAQQASHYGSKICVIYPVGQFKIAWSPNVDDVTGMFIRNQNAKNDTDEKAIAAAIKQLKAAPWSVDMADFLNRPPVLRATFWDLNFEAALHCTSYYAVQRGSDTHHLINETLGRA